MNWSEAMRRECPRCGAAAATNCRGPNGRLRSAHHRERYGDNPINRPRRSRASRCNTEGWVYFIGPQGGATVKIGWSKEGPERRLRELQTGNGEALHLYGKMRGTERTEQALHEVFKHLRLQGEWFSFEDILYDYISQASE